MAVGVVFAALVIASMLALGAWWYAEQALAGIPTFDEVAVGHAPPPTSLAGALPTTPTSAPLELAESGVGVEGYLVFSVGSAGVAPEEAATIGIPPGRASQADNLTDTIMLLLIDRASGTTGVLSIPRDTWLISRNTRVNTVYARHGAQALAGEVVSLTGLPVTHMVAVNFAAFATLTDEVGGVEVWLPGPARDRLTGLVVEAEGCTTLDGTTALAYVRSRHWEVPDGRGGWRPDRSADDFGRITRQHQFLRAVVAKLATPASVARVPALVGVAQDNLIVDADLSLADVITLGQRFVTSPREVEYFTLPGVPGRAGAASVLYVDEDAAAPILDHLRGLATPAPPPSLFSGSSSQEPAPPTTPATPNCP